MPLESHHAHTALNLCGVAISVLEHLDREAKDNRTTEMVQLAEAGRQLDRYDAATAKEKKRG